MNKIANKQVICNVLLEAGKKDKDIMVLCSDSRGSGSMTEFADTLADQFVEVGIAEQNLVSVAAGLASCGKKPYAVSPACFLASRSMEQAKVDVAYSGTNVKLIGISGGVSYGALGLTHHSVNDIAAMASNPGMRVYIPSDRLQTEKLMQALLQDEKGAYIRVGRNAVEDVYEEGNVPFEMDHATVVREGTDAAVIACGEMVAAAKKAACLLEEQGIHIRVLDMYCIKPMDAAAVEAAVRETRAVVTIEEHVAIGGMGSMVSQIAARTGGARVVNLTLPDSPVITGSSKEVFEQYGLTAEGIVQAVKELLN